jgi:hypothetical protein
MEFLLAGEKLAEKSNPAHTTRLFRKTTRKISRNGKRFGREILRFMLFPAGVREYLLDRRSGRHHSRPGNGTAITGMEQLASSERGLIIV